MRVVPIAGCLCIGLLVHGAAAQGPGPALHPSPWSSGRLGVMGGMTYESGGTYGAQLTVLYSLTPENRPLSFRIQGHAAWSPFQTERIPVPSLGQPFGFEVSAGTSRQIGGGIAAILHARPRSRVSPYLIMGYGIAQRWQDGTEQSYDQAGLPSAPPVPWPHSYTSGDFNVGAGIRARAGSQMFRLEVTRSDNRTALSLGMSKPF
jgi:hypothetical protein